MVIVSVGDVVDLAGAKHGMNEKGEWLMASVRSERGTDRIDIFLHDKNAHDAQEWQTGKITKILSARRNARKYQNTWVQSTSINAEMIEGPARQMKQTPDDDYFVAPPDDLDGLPFA